LPEGRHFEILRERVGPPDEIVQLKQFVEKN